MWLSCEGLWAYCKTLEFYYVIENESFFKKYFRKEQDLGIVLRCYSLDFHFKILPCGFFSCDGSVFFN